MLLSAKLYRKSWDIQHDKIIKISFILKKKKDFKINFEKFQNILIFGLFI
jgi:hypothetical protein